MSAIDDKYNGLGGPGGWLGRPVDEGAGDQEMPTASGRGRVRDYQNGSIYWSAETGAHEVHGAIRVKWAQLGGEGGFLGFPTTDETGTPDGVGRFNHFQGGSIYWTPETGPHEVHGDIRAEWAKRGWETGRLGYPVSDELPWPDGPGRMSNFQGGSILWRQANRSLDVRFRID
jgi:uncharacterized protein with LGFP repeats